MRTIPTGCYPAMITPFTMDGQIDYPAVERALRWYENHQCAGVLALCASSETELLNLEERTKLAKFIADHKGKLIIVTSGNISEDFEEQVVEMNAMANSGADAICFITSRLNKLANFDEDKYIELLDKLVDRIENKDVLLGFYEQPGELNLPLSPKILKHCAATGRYVFVKETSCQTETIRTKIEACKGTNLGIYNANSTLLYESLKDGAAGFCGMMGNVHPDLYQWLCDNWKRYPGMAATVSAFTSVAGECTAQWPAIAKYCMNSTGAEMTIFTRRNGLQTLTEQNMYRMDQLEVLANGLRAQLNNLK